MGNAKSAMSEPDGGDTTYRWPFLVHVSRIRLFLGPITAILIWIIAFSLLPSAWVGIGVLFLFLALPTTLLEFSWLISKCTFCPPEGPFCKVWHFFLRLDTWKRGAFYGLTFIICFAVAWASAFAIIAGICYVVLSVCYILKTFQHKPPEQLAAAGMQYAGNMAAQQYSQQGPPPPYGGGMGGVPDPNKFTNVPPYGS